MSSQPPRESLSLSVASQDRTKQIKLRELLLVFYGDLGKMQFKHAAQVLWSKLYATEFHRTLVYLLPPLILLVACESTYYSLAFTLVKEQKKIKDMFINVLGDLNHSSAEFDEMETNPTASPESKKAGAFFSQLLKQTCLLVNTRIKMIDIYLLFLDTSNAIPKYSSIKKKLENLKAPLFKIFSHPFMQQVRHNVMSELDVLEKLIITQIKISNCKFKDALFFLCQTKAELDSWKYKFNFDEVAPPTPQNRLRGSTPIVSRPVGSEFGAWSALHKWFSKYHEALYSKFHLYLSKKLKEKKSEIKLDLPHSDYISRLRQYVEESKCFNISLLVQPPPAKQTEGIRSWPGKFTCPQEEPPTIHWPNIISLISDHIGLLNTYGNSPLCYYDTKVETTYYIIKVERRMIMVILFGCKKEQDDIMVGSFVREITSELRNVKIFQQLKPQSLPSTS